MTDEDAPTRVAITGIAGYLGRELAAQFDVDPATKSVLGIDVAAFTPGSPKTKFVQRSVEEPFADLFLEHRVNAALHLAFVLNPTHDREREERVNIQGTKNFLDACSKAKVKTVLVASSATAYGARPDNPEVLYEGAPLRATPDFPYAHDKIRVEDLCYEFVKANPDVCLQIVRPSIIIGPHANNFMTRLLEKPIVFAPRGYNPPLQFIHEDDAVRALVRLLRSRKVGVFNLTADGAITFRKIAELAGRRLVRLPLFLVRWLVALGWRFGWKWLTEAPPGYLDYAVYPWVISNIKVKTELFFLFKHDAARAVRDYIDRDEKPAAPSRTLLDEDDVDDIDELDHIVASKPAPEPAPPSPPEGVAPPAASPVAPPAASPSSETPPAKADEKPVAEAKPPEPIAEAKPPEPTPPSSGTNGATPAPHPDPAPAADPVPEASPLPAPTTSDPTASVAPQPAPAPEASADKPAS